MYKICRGPAEADAFFHEVSAMSGALTMFELTTSAHRLAGELAKTEPRSRGRSHRVNLRSGRSTDPTIVRNQR